MAKVRSVRPGERLSSSKQNELVGAANLAGEPDVIGGVVASGRGGPSIFIPPANSQLAMFELANGFTFPSGGSDAPYSDDAKRVPFDGEKYEANEDATATVYYPLAARDGDGAWAGQPVVVEGTRVVCWWNRQSKRWEIVAFQWMAQKAKWIRFSAQASFTTSNETFSAAVVFYADGKNPDPNAEGITIYNHEAAVGYIFGGDAGAFGSALYLPESDRYYAIQMECP